MRTIILGVLSLLLVCNVALAEKKIVCYFTNSAVYRTGNGRFDVSNIDPNLCSHLVYLHAGVTSDGQLLPSDTNADLPDNYGKNGYGHFNQLRNVNPNVKTLLAVGGVNVPSSIFSNIASNSRLTLDFTTNLVAYLKKYGFDGVDLQWAYPAMNGGNAADRQNYVSLLSVLQYYFKQENLTLAATHIGVRSSASLAYDIPSISKCLDFVHVITYDLHGSWDGVTGFNSPLYPGSSDYLKTLNIDDIFNYWLGQGIPAEKLVFTIPTYGRSFTLASSANFGIGAPILGPGSAGPYTGVAGMIGYNEHLERIEQDYYELIEHDGEQFGVYAKKGNQWLGLDDYWTVREKVKYGLNRNIGGFALYTLDTDDFRGIRIKYDLLNEINYYVKFYQTMSHN